MTVLSSYPLLCAIDGCLRKRHARGWCQKHYDMWRLHGDPLTPPHVIVGDDDARFWAYVSVGHPAGCWWWDGALNDGGYGAFRVQGKTVQAYRYAYQLLVGPIPPDCELDHLCRNHRCVNPNHLEAVPHRTNLLRGEGLGALNLRKTHCPRGHPYAGDNLYVDPRTGKRFCRACHRLSDARKRSSQAQ